MADWLDNLGDTLVSTWNAFWRTIFTWLWDILSDVLTWLLSVLGWWVKPFIDALVIMLPDPTSLGFRYMFEAYHFASAWFDFEAFYYVITTIVSLHFLSWTVRALLWLFRMIVKVKLLIPFV